MPHEAKAKFVPLLEVLLHFSVDFIVVGGVSAALHGAPVTTFDLDVVHARDPENISRLLNALVSLDAYYRFHPETRLKPQALHLSSPGHQLLMTRFGPLDLLGALSGDRSYGDLFPHTTEMTVGPNVRVRVLDLETLIQVKEETGGEKDQAVLPILRRTLRERRRSR